MRDRDQNIADSALDGGFPRGSANQDQRPAILAVPDFDVRPGDAVASARSHGFQDCLLGGPASREVLDRVLPGLAITDFAFGVHPAQEELAVVLDHLADARAFDDVGADSKDLHSSPSSRHHARRSSGSPVAVAKPGWPVSVFSLHPSAANTKARGPAVVDRDQFAAPRVRHCGSRLPVRSDSSSGSLSGSVISRAPRSNVT